MTIPRHNQSLLTQRLRIRIFEERDLLSLMPVFSDPLVTQYLPYGPWKSELDAHAWLRKTNDRLKDGRAAQYIIERRDDAALIGACLYFNHDAAKASAEFGYVLGQRYWHQGFMLEAMTAFTDHIVTELKLDSLNAIVEKPNATSLNLLAKLGLEKAQLIQEDGVELHVLTKHFL